MQKGISNGVVTDFDGKYDNAAGGRNSSYIVTNLYEVSMLLAVGAENGDVC